MRYFLNFIENQQSIFGLDIHAAFDFQTEQQAADVVIARKQGFHARIVVKIDIGGLGKIPFAEMLHRPRFTNLPCTLNNQRLAIGFVFPLF